MSALAPPRPPAASMPPPPTPRRRPAAWWLVAGSVLVVLTVGWGTLNVVELIAREQRTEVVEYHDAITSIDVAAEHGSVRVVAADVPSTVLTMRISEGLGSPTIRHEVIGDRLVLSSSCRRSRTCGARCRRCSRSPPASTSSCAPAMAACA